MPILAMMPVFSCDSWHKVLLRGLSASTYTLPQFVSCTYNYLGLVICITAGLFWCMSCPGSGMCHHIRVYGLGLNPNPTYSGGEYLSCCRQSGSSSFWCATLSSNSPATVLHSVRLQCAYGQGSEGQLDWPCPCFSCLMGRSLTAASDCWPSSSWA